MRALSEEGRAARGSGGARVGVWLVGWVGRGCPGSANPGGRDGVLSRPRPGIVLAFGTPVKARQRTRPRMPTMRARAAGAPGFPNGGCGRRPGAAPRCQAPGRLGGRPCPVGVARSTGLSHCHQGVRIAIGEESGPAPLLGRLARGGASQSPRHGRAACTSLPLHVATVAPADLHYICFRVRSRDSAMPNTTHRGGLPGPAACDRWRH